MELSVVIPVYNEADNIRPLASEIHAALVADPPYEIVLVDDGSTDGTGDVLAELSAGDARVRCVQHSQNRGQSTAIRTGVKAARSEWIVTLDGDGQNDPADIPKLLEVIASADDEQVVMVAGHRAKRQDVWLKRCSSRIANRVRAALLHDQTADTGCGLKLFSREAFLDLPFFDHMHRFLPALIQREGGKVVSVDVNHRLRVKGHSKYGLHNRLWVGIVDLIGVRWLQRRIP